MIFTSYIHQFERGLLYRRGDFASILGPGRHWIGPRERVRVVSVRQPTFVDPDLEAIAGLCPVHPDLVWLDIKDGQRGLVWSDGRFHGICGPGLHAFWTVSRDLRTETVATEEVRFDHPQLRAILAAPGSAKLLAMHDVPSGYAGLLILNGQLRDTLAPGRYVFWRDVASVNVTLVDLREQALEVTGQEIMTSDKVTLRVNAVVAYRIRDARRAAESVSDASGALYRQVQLGLRESIGTRSLDAILTDKDELAVNLETDLRAHAAGMGMELVAVGIKDIILPGDMKALLNRVTEAQKAAEAALITRREETAAMRSQANSARILEGNPTLMRMREIEALEKIADKARMTVILGEKGLTDRVTNLL